MLILLLSLLAGFLTVLAPCILPLLPIILSTSADGNKTTKVLQVVTGLILSILLFTFLLRVSTVFIDIPTRFWSLLSGVFISLYSFTLIFPELWGKISLGINSKSDKLLNQASGSKNKYSNYMIGAALGPVFNSCSPTYALLLSIVLPQSIGLGVTSILLYCVGLAIPLILIGLLGQRATKRLKWGANPNGVFRKILGLVMLVVGILLMLDLFKVVETNLVNSGGWDWLLDLEYRLLDNTDI